MSQQFLDSTKAVRSGEELELATLEPFLREHLPHSEGPLTIEQFFLGALEPDLPRGAWQR